MALSLLRNSLKRARNAFMRMHDLYDDRVIEPLSKFFPGWRLGVATSILIAFVSLLLNVIFLGISVSRNPPGSNGLGIFIEAKCEAVDWWNRILHGIINITSTLLVQQSNSCMQKLSSPTRDEIDTAHRRREWVDIGIQSFRNVWQRSIAIERVAVWWILAMSSTILHLLWNSIILASPTSYEYVQLAVTDQFITDHQSYNASRDLPVFDYAGVANAFYPDNLDIVRSSLHGNDSWERLDTAECIRNYTQPFLRDRSDVVVVVEAASHTTAGSSVLGAASAGWGNMPYAWMCPDDPTFLCATQFLKSNPGWSLTYRDADYIVQHCYSKTMHRPCTLLYAYIVTILVICANVVKLICFVATYWLLANTETKAREKGGSGTIILSPGDAIATFLEREDETTHGICLAEKSHFELGLWEMPWIDIRPIHWRARHSKASFRAIGLWRWITFMAVMLSLPLAAAIFLMSQLDYYHSLAITTTSIRELGFGSPLGQFLFGSWSSSDNQSAAASIRDVFLANLPQLVLSIEQFWWSSHLTCIIAAREYDSFAAAPCDHESTPLMASQQGRSLSVTRPKAGTEQVPDRTALRWIVLNQVVWTALPWLASQAVFFAKIDVLDHWMYITSWGISQVGYSVLGLVAFTVAGIVAWWIAFYLGVRRLKNCLPLAGTCSAAISAACHPLDPDDDHHEKLILWGEEIPSLVVVDEDGDANDDNPRQIGRCAFTSGKVKYPEAGKEYE